MRQRLLVLGGTEFVGHATVAAALEQDWEVTVFNRGLHETPAGVRALRGDRTAPGGLDALAAAPGEWDLVVDTWSSAPRAVRDSAALLADRAAHYAYVSSCSVYTWPRRAGTGIEAPVVDGDPDAAATDYPADKRGGELAAARAFGAERSVFARAGLILGPHENVGRLPWWLTRLARGGPVLAPGPKDLPLQYIDARDLGAWLLHAGTEVLHGPYDLASAPGHTTMGELLETGARVTGGTAELRWTAPEKVLAAGIEPWTELPVWIPPGEDYDAIHDADTARTLAAGLRCRPVAETVEDTWAWLRTVGGVVPPRPGRPAKGLAPEREAAVLAAE